MIRAIGMAVMSICIGMAPITAPEVIVSSGTLNDDLTLTTDYGMTVELMGEEAGDWLLDPAHLPDVMVIGETYDIIWVGGKLIAVEEVLR